jgi:hypothetical protein
MDPSNGHGALGFRCALCLACRRCRFPIAQQRAHRANRSRRRSTEYQALDRQIVGLSTGLAREIEEKVVAHEREEHAGNGRHAHADRRESEQRPRGLGRDSVITESRDVRRAGLRNHGRRRRDPIVVRGFRGKQSGLR